MKSVGLSVCQPKRLSGVQPTGKVGWVLPDQAVATVPPAFSIFSRAEALT
jgi:hypothetical protein